MNIRSLAALLQSGLGSRLFGWVARRIPFPSIERLSESLGYRLSRRLLLAGWRLVRATMSAADVLSGMRGNQMLPRSEWPILRSIPRAYQVWVRIDFIPSGGGARVTRRQIIDFDRNPSAVEITSAARREARRRIERGTDPALDREPARVVISIEAAFRRTA